MATTSERRDFTKAPLRSRFEAMILEAAAHADHQLVGDQKERIIGAMRGTIVEFGPGVGANLPFYADGVKVIAIEPNPVMQEHLRKKAAEHDIDLEIRSEHGEDVDEIPDASIDGVVGTLLLCGVDDPEQLLSQIKRILKPGGTYFFYEHVVAPDGSATRWLQRIVKQPHKYLGNGCEVDRGTSTTLRSAGFDELVIEQLDAGPGLAWTRHCIVGHAVA